MASMLAMLSGVSFLPFPPRYEMYYIEWVPDQEFGALPAMFNRRFHDEIPLSVVLSDPVGNQMHCIIVKADGKAFFADGWKNTGAFYGLYLGGWLRIVYFGLGRFLMQVFNNYGDEVVYPPLPLPTLMSEPTNPPDVPPPPPSTDGNLVNTENNGYVYTITKTLTHADITTNGLSLPVVDCASALPATPADVRIFDEDGKKWVCHLKEDVVDGSQCVLTKGWTRFRRFKGLVEGQTIQFGVRAPNSEDLYFISA